MRPEALVKPRRRDQLDGRTVAVVPPSTMEPAPGISWWHEEQCKVLTATGCTCRSASHQDKAS
jgi:hypothetical protein